MTWIGEEVDEAYYEAVMGIEINPGMDKSGFENCLLTTTWNKQYPCENLFRTFRI